VNLSWVDSNAHPAPVSLTTLTYRRKRLTNPQLSEPQLRTDNPMKTAMQELLIDLMINLEREIGHRLNMEKFAPHLEKEKKQIINAHTNAYLIGEDDISVEDANKASEQYYNQTYK
jgi:hypothetical protein